ncbi:NAD(P)-binding protein [Halorubellus sp. JP-L1]|uniref:NAD(P)/FAD-dependent oxidoreductase n=1 Tax=Halorubellus sp. JP-L1 TaxID=2715753 RepID=UPI001407D542|nr:NAD(P)-binding protein [Halorubellus sp. JP-L1]NHN41206.1 NAD(P)-binding protein [Halorubellus sp. JP-L1]
MSERVAVVGAGVAGCGVADALAGTDREVVVVEKARGVSGRAATRRKHGCRYDHGANYVKPGEDDEFTGVLESFGVEGLHDVAEPVWVHDADGDIQPGRERDARKWTYEAGITQFAKRVLDASDATVELETEIESLERDDAASDDATATGPWSLVDADGERYAGFDRVVLTPPAPQTAALLAATAWDDDRRDAVRAAADGVAYRTVRTLVLHYDFRVDRPWYALVDPEQTHPVGWLAREECKPGHVPDGESLLIAQMSPAWSVAHDDDPTETAASAAADRVADLLADDRYRDPNWVDSQGWRYALPENAAGDAVRAAEAAGLYCAGDWVVGDGRVHRAFENGRTVGRRLRERG